MVSDTTGEHIFNNRRSSSMKNRETPTKKEYPENIRQFMDLVSAVLNRIKNKHLNNSEIAGSVTLHTPTGLQLGRTASAQVRATSLRPPC